MTLFSILRDVRTKLSTPEESADYKRGVLDATNASVESIHIHTEELLQMIARQLGQSQDAHHE